tara:strand:+ start:389 stop:766 length:378 start_codon:yes stop_codon:yes gene_type:complete
MFQTITKDNWLLFAQKHYDNPTLEKEAEFYDDLKRFKYIKRLLGKYKAGGNFKVRLALNHIIVLQNVFGVEACVTLLLFKIDRKYWSVLKTILIYLDYLYPNELNEVPEDEKVKEKLRGLYGNKW